MTLLALEALGFARDLFKILNEIKKRCHQRKENVSLAEELQHFVQELQQNMDKLETKVPGTCSNASSCALAALGEDLKNATTDANNILEKGLIKAIWRSMKTLKQIQALRKRVMTSFQTRILFTTLDVAIEGKKEMEDFKAAMLKISDSLKEVYADSLKEVYATSNDSVKEVLRSELKLALQPVMAVTSQWNEEKLKAATSIVRSTDPQTDEAEKFFADVLAELEQIRMESNKREADANGSSVPSNSGEGSTSWQSFMDWLEDPITSELMCDPVKGVDGHTYDRWTVIQHAANSSRSPLSPNQPWEIATDDIDMRSRLFALFPEQEAKFRSKRASYREEALEMADRGCFGDAVNMLGHVLQWNPDDKECQERRDQALPEVEKGESVLAAGQSLQAGSLLRKGPYRLIMQNDDNLVIYYVGSRTYPTWHSNTCWRAGAKGECYLTMQEDGNLVLYRGGSERKSLWATNSQAVKSDYALHLKETGSFEIRSSSGGRHWCMESMKTLMAGESLRAGSFLLNGAYMLRMRRDDNLVIYHLRDSEWDRPIWASGTALLAGGEGKCRLVMQHDCNLVIYNAAGHTVWASNSRSPELLNYGLHLHLDGNLNIRSPDGRVMWRS